MWVQVRHSAWLPLTFHKKVRFILDLKLSKSVNVSVLFVYMCSAIDWQPALIRTSIIENTLCGGCCLPLCFLMYHLIGF